LERVDIGKSRKPRDLFVQSRIVFHRARAERKQSEVDCIILARETCVMTDRFRFGEPWEVDFA
jgi:hypothetical protein